MPRFGGARTRLGVSLYLCFVDESGSHGASPVFVVGGIIVHEEDAWHLQQRLDKFLFRKLRPLGLDHTMYELHATEMWRGRKRWRNVAEADRRRVLAGAYATLAVTRRSTLNGRGASSAQSWSGIPRTRSSGRTNCSRRSSTISCTA
ncbi:DUF3800 domain-containing protein [Candidatus Poriferisodalis sp.]|uniref:DUF3800 domain-containing protein n=1 Tax=Candidatus Poriferisodalis sp. TaxID=3101277 RepID=UPI003B011FE5